MSSSFSFEWQQDNTRQVRDTIKRALTAGLRIAGEHLLGVSNRRVPHEDGDLERSGVVSEVSDTEVAISYDTPYAVIQHEDLSLRHDAGRSAKFLEVACRAEAATAGRLIATHVRKVVGN